jgi:hypothetical protein
MNDITDAGIIFRVSGSANHSPIGSPIAISYKQVVCQAYEADGVDTSSLALSASKAPDHMCPKKPE